MKRVSHTLTYAGTTVSEVFTMFADPTYRKAVSNYQRVIDFDCRITRDGDTMEVSLEQAHSTNRIPGYAQKLVGDEIRFVQQETWTSPSSADLQMAIPGKPGEIAGTESLEQSGDDVVWTVDLSVKVSIPFVGGKVEDLIAGFIGKAYDAEHEVGVTWLAER